jgi:predicted ATPase
MLGITLLGLGNLDAARAHLEHGVTLYDPDQHHAHVFLYGQDPKVAYLSQTAVLLCLLGYPDQAVRRLDDAVSLAHAVSHPFSLVGALFCASLVHQLRGDAPKAQERAEAVVTLATEQGFPFFLSQATILRGWALAEQGSPDEGIAMMRQGLDAYQATGAAFVRPHYLALLAEASGKAGLVDVGLIVLDEALDMVREDGEERWKAELSRLKGELLLQATSHAPPDLAVAAEAEACFRRAVHIARQQQAKLLELQAVLSMSRLRQQQGVPETARAALSAVYGWFTEGFETAHLREASALLEAPARASTGSGRGIARSSH